MDSVLGKGSVKKTVIQDNHSSIKPYHISIVLDGTSIAFKSAYILPVKNTGHGQLDNLGWPLFESISGYIAEISKTRIEVYQYIDADILVCTS